MATPADNTLRPSLIERAAMAVGAYGFASRRMQARLTCEAYRAYTSAADHDRTTGNWREVNAHAQAVWRADAPTIRRRVRFLIDSDAYARNAQTVIRDNVIGTGIQTQPRVQYSADLKTNRRLNTQLADAKYRWMEREADAKGYGNSRLHWYEIQQARIDSLVANGEAILLESFIPDRGRSLPLAYELIDPDRLTVAGAQPLPGNVLVDGLELDPLGRVVAYWIGSDDPQVTGTWRWKAVRYPAERVLHYYRLDRIGQLRGLSWFTPIIPQLYALKDITEYALIARKVQAAVALIISRNPAGGGAPPGLKTSSTEKDGAVQTRKGIEPGMIHEVPYDAKVTSHVPAPTGDLEPLTRLMLRGIGVGFGLSYAFMSGDYSQSNFAGGRLAGLNSRKRFRSIHAMECWKGELPVHRRFVDVATAYGRITAPPRSADPYAVKFTNPSWELGGNPVQEVEAAARRIALKISSHRAEVEDKGGDLEEVWAEIGQDQQLADELGIDITTALGDPTVPTPAEDPTDPAVEIDPSIPATPAGDL